MPRRYKTPRLILQHARDYLANPNHYTQGALCNIVYKGDVLEVLGRGERDETLPVATLESAKTLQNEDCACCVLGAIREHTVKTVFEFGPRWPLEAAILKTEAGILVERAARELYPIGRQEMTPYAPNTKLADTPNYSRAVAVNDGDVHKTVHGAYKATLRILDRAIELAS